MILIRAGKPRAVWLCVLLCFVAGCSSYRTVYLPGETDRATTGESREVVRDGLNVRVNLKNGEVVKGQVVKASKYDLIIRESGFCVPGNTVITTGEIESIEHGSLSMGSKLGIAAGLVGTVLLFAELTDIDETTGK